MRYRRLLPLLQLLQNRPFQTLRLRGARPSNLDFPILSDQKLLKVPLDPLQAHQSGLLFLHPLEHRLRFVAVDVRLAKDREADAVVELAEFLDRVVGARVLAAELVTREAEDGEGIGVLGGDVLV